MLIRQISVPTLLLAATMLVAPAKAETLVIHQDTAAPFEIATMNILRGMFEKGGDVWNDLTIPHSSGSAVTLGGLIVAGNPPDIFYSPDPDIYADLKQQGNILDLSDWFQTPRGRDAYNVMPDILRKSIELDGQKLRAPHLMHVDGVICYNLAVAADAGVKPSSWTSFDDFYADFAKIKDKGYIPLAFGADNFQMGYLFHSLVAHFAGNIYDRVYGVKPDESVLDTPEMRKVLQEFRKVQQHTDPGAPGRRWNDATNMVITGTALLQIQGDWMQGEFRAAGKVQDKDYSCITFPGAKGLAVTINPWGFVDTHDPAKTAAQYRFLDANFDPVVQLQSAQTKGAAPARLDLDTSTLLPWTQKFMKLLQQPDMSFYVTPTLTADPDWRGEIWNVASKFWADPNMTEDQAVELLQSAYRQVF